MRDPHPLHLTRLSQGHINLLETCPRKFQHIYLEQLSSPLDPERQERAAWGSQFHQLMQQRELGLSVESLLAEDDPLRHSVKALVKAVPEILSAHAYGDREAEHYRTLNFNGYLLTVIYDLLITNPKNAQIFDWKTYPLPQNASKIKTHWQTRLYLFVLAETADYRPESLSMTYWFVRLPERPRRLTLSYNRRQHERTREELSLLLSQFEQYLERYLEDGIQFPQVPEGKGECGSCHFNYRCHRPQPTDSSGVQNWRSAIAEIEEISL
jgi:hypothetical protein